MSTELLYTTPGSGTATIPVDAVDLVIEVWAAGGGAGGGGGSKSQGGSGGGGGGYTKTTIASPGTSYPYTVGAGGTGGTSGPADYDGTDGGDSFVGTAGDYPAYANGGSYGTGVFGGGGTGGLGGLASPWGDVLRAGGDGSNGGAAAAGAGGGGAGATSDGGDASGTTGGLAGGPDAGAGGNGNGSNGYAYGGGGGGGVGAGSGGDGADGAVRFTWSVPPTPTPQPKSLTGALSSEQRLAMVGDSVRYRHRWTLGKPSSAGGSLVFTTVLHDSVSGPRRVTDAGVRETEAFNQSLQRRGRMPTGRYIFQCSNSDGLLYKTTAGNYWIQGTYQADPLECYVLHEVYIWTASGWSSLDMLTFLGKITDIKHLDSRRETTIETEAFVMRYLRRAFSEQDGDLSVANDGTSNLQIYGSSSGGT